MSRIPAAWQREIDAGTAFGQRAAAAAARIRSCHQATGQPETRPRLPRTAVNVRGRRGCTGCGKSQAIPRGFLEKAARRAVNLKNAAVDFWQDGMALASDEQQAHRLAVCSACPIQTDGWCDDAKGGCGCKLRLKIKARAAYCPAGKWYEYGDRYQPLLNPTRNLIFHVYPKIGAEWNWHWHLSNIRRVAHLFNGRICIGIGVDDNTASADEVQRLLAGVPVAEWIVRPNTKQMAETETLPHLLAAVQTDDPNTITLRGHCKGVTHSRTGIEQTWARLMWSACMHLPSVDDALASHLMAGPLKCHEPLVSKQRYRWFYAGSWYWFRNREIFQRDWSTMEPTRWYVEAWPGVLAPNEDAACLCHDFTDGSVLREAYWRAVVEPSWEAWKAARPDRMVELEH